MSVVFKCSRCQNKKPKEEFKEIKGDKYADSKA